MIRNVFSILCLVGCVAAGSASEAPGLPFTNPVIPGDYPDPSVIRVGKDYYATATTSEWGPEFQILRSRDLVRWKPVGVVFPHRPAWAVGNFWAPEIAEHLGRYYVYYVARKRGGPLAVAVATAAKPEGPYVDHGPLVAQEAGSIDPMPITDENGDRYLVWKEDGNSRRLPTILWAQRLTRDGLRLVGERTALFHNDAGWEGAVVEGPFVVRRADGFYLFYSGNACCGLKCGYALGVARSRKLLGPWEKAPTNPILAGNDDWRCPGHGSIVRDPAGRYFLLYHAYDAKSSVFTGREALLDEVIFGADGWPVIRGGRGPSPGRSAPQHAAIREKATAFFDDFSRKSLGLGWQWPQDNEPILDFGSGGPGELILRPTREHSEDIAGAVLGRSTTMGDYTAEGVIDIARCGKGSVVGVSAFGDAANAIGLAHVDGKLRLWLRNRGQTTVLREVDAPPGQKLHLRLSASNGRDFQFAASADGRAWVAVGSDQQGSHLPPWDRAVRVALTVGGRIDAQGAFDSFRIRPGT
ncbi:MAG: family 43 glycosylhydrolase [Verrucomicrobia bacterium]|nr:family 43 glycosylhydrolase [Verrucomicrobiota bacterium]MBI3869765.1 family 43 glycosylhydrolase [Verrucomicrobiota bacterium]